MNRSEFAAGVSNRYSRLGEAQFAKSATLSRSFAVDAAPPVGHPEYADLRLGEIASCEMAIAFIDMRAMTARSFWEPLGDVTRLTLAVLGQVALVVQESGGFVLGLRGDGLMAGWGSSGSQPDVDVYMAMAASAFCLDAVQNAVNEILRIDGIKPVQVCAGADWGKVNLARTGTPQGSEVNIVGHPANFAAKCEKTANSWEVVVGESLAAHVRNTSLLAAHPDSPKVYQYGENRRAYRFYDFSWRRILSEASSAINQVAGRPTNQIRVQYEGESH